MGIEVLDVPKELVGKIYVDGGDGRLLATGSLYDTWLCGLNSSVLTA